MNRIIFLYSSHCIAVFLFLSVLPLSVSKLVDFMAWNGFLVILRLLLLFLSRVFSLSLFLSCKSKPRAKCQEFVTAASDAGVVSRHPSCSSMAREWMIHESSFSKCLFIYGNELKSRFILCTIWHKNWVLQRKNKTFGHMTKGHETEIRVCVYVCVQLLKAYTMSKWFVILSE